MPFRRKTTTTQ
jgi:8-hydroxy-5-deazaflavin:NADPH oxidoreductase